MSSLSPPLADKLAKVLGMLGSSHDGEVLVAARTADRMVKEAGATWQEALLPAALPVPEPSAHPGFARWTDAREFCINNIGMLDDRDAAFVWGMVRLSTWETPSPKQLKWLTDCARKLQVRGCRP
jgi:hypothetical protein